MINRGDIKLAIDMVVNAQDDNLFGGEAEYVINTLEECGNTIAAQAAEISHMRGVMECHAIDLRERDAAIKFHAEKTRAQAAVIEKLREALEQLWNGCENLHDNALDEYDKGYTRAMADSCKAALAIPTDSTQVLAEVRRAERERVARYIEDSALLVSASTHAAAIRAME